MAKDLTNEGSIIDPAVWQPIADGVLVAAARLGISRSGVYREIAIGRLKSVKCGRRRLVPRSAQLEWLASLPSN